MIRAATRDNLASLARDHLSLDVTGRPACDDSAAIVNAAAAVSTSGDEELVDELLIHGFLRGSTDRYEAYVKPQLQRIPSCSFAMGSDRLRTPEFCGEAPKHSLFLSSFEIGVYPVTNAFFRLLDRRTLSLSASEEAQPVVDVTWFDAQLFAMWVGCRLPTEAEWEYACGGGGEAEWCCGQEADLHRFTWYSENSHGEPQAVGAREPNELGLFDMHGSVWEWCQDDYDASFYSRSPRTDPVCRLTDALGFAPHKVSRGGSVHSLAEMCRTRYRQHDPPSFFAFDLGFRLARDLSREREV